MTAALKLSRDRKVSPLSKWARAAERWEPEVPNSFGLPAGPAFSCPGATKACEAVCYAKRTEVTFTSAARLVRHNWDALQGKDASGMAELLAEAVGAYLKDHARVEALRGKSLPKVFRIHWDGDFFSVPYAKAWRAVIESHADVTFWAYTRSFGPRVNVVPVLADLPNLSLYLSVDAYNKARAEKVAARYPSVRLAVMAETFAEAQAVTVTLTGRKAPRCPENARKVPLVDGTGEGACVSCGLCVHGRQGVLFSTSQK